MLVTLLALALVAANSSSKPSVMQHPAATAPPVAIASAAAAPLPACAESDPAKEALHAFSSHSESLTSLALLIIGGSLLVLLQRDYIRPPTRSGRAFYLLFVLGWSFLALSMWHGRRAQSVYLAYLTSTHNTDAKTLFLKKAADKDLGHQLDFLERGLFVFALWLIGYLSWWIFSNTGAENNHAGSGIGTGSTHGSGQVGVVILIFFLMPLFAHPGSAGASDCDCPHPPWSTAEPPTPSCYDQCALNIANSSTVLELSLLHLDEATAHAIVAARKTKGLQSLADLPAEPRKRLITTLANADLVVAGYLASSVENKEQLATRLKADHADIYQAWLAASARDHAGITECRLRFSLKEWSAFYKEIKGEATITCDNGQRADVTLSAKGGGLAAGKFKIRDGVGKFSDVADISELFGTYAQASASAGAEKSADASAMTKGEVSLALSGKGTGVELGVSFGKFTITPSQRSIPQLRPQHR